MAAKGVRIARFDRDHAEDLNLVKLDLLSLKTINVPEDPAGTIAGLSYERIPLNGRATCKMLSSYETLDVVQLENPAQRAPQVKDMDRPALADIPVGAVVPGS